MLLRSTALEITLLINDGSWGWGGGQHDRSRVNLCGQIHNLGGQPFSPLNLYIIQKRSFLDLHRK